MQQRLRASQAPAWYDDQPYDIGERVELTDEGERQRAGGAAGRVVGYDASGPRKGEEFIRVLVLVERDDPQIMALAPAALRRASESERTQLARAMLDDLRQSLGDANFARLRAWFQGEVCAGFLADPDLVTRNIRLGTLLLPGFLLPELVRLSDD